MENCIFCKIVSGEIPSKFVYENNYVIAINDLNPQAKTHILVIPKVHVDKFSELDDENLIKEIFKGVQQTAKTLGLTDYRLIVNNGKNAGQTVFHLHIHILAGETLSERIN